MRTIFLVLASFILIIAFQNCNDNTLNNEIVTDRADQPKIVSKSDPLPCCNLGRPENCNSIGEMSLMTDIGDVIIDCECCQELWDFFNGELPPGSKISHLIIGSYVCVPNIEQEN